MNNTTLSLQNFKPIILTIAPVHAAPIYAKTKLFELRRFLPKEEFNVVFLYEIKPVRAITGFFVPGRVITAPSENLWEMVGEAATSKDRFDRYFKGLSLASAIEVVSALRLDINVPLNATPTSNGKTLRISQNFVYVKDNRSIEFLYDIYKSQYSHRMEKVTLDPIQPDDFERFKEYVLKVVDKLYDDIGEDYALQLWESNKAGFEKNGFMTLTKRIYRVNLEGHHIGYAVLTFKRGGSVKSGPILLFEEFRNRGYGKLMRQAIESIALNEGFRKVYCTMPATHRIGINYLLSTGYKIEAHLTSHYREKGDEIAFGKILYPPPAALLSPEFTKTPETEKLKIQTIQGTDSEVDFCVNIFHSHYGIPRDVNWISNLLRDALTQPAHLSYRSKPRRAYALVGSASQSIYGLFIIALKRSSISKVFPLLNVNTPEVLHAIISTLEEAESTRKMIFFVPVIYSALYKVLKQKGYVVEGILREPYSSGNDLIVLSKITGN